MKPDNPAMGDCMSFWDRVCHALGGRSSARSTPKAVLAAGLSGSPGSNRLPIGTDLVASDALIKHRLPPEPSPKPALPPARRRCGGESIPVERPLYVRPLDTHVEMFHAFILDNCTPGDVLDPDEILELYDVMCSRQYLVPRSWKTIAAKLRPMMPEGPDGSPKPYHPFLQLDGTTIKRRAWYVPRKRQPAPRRKPTVDERSIPELEVAA